MKQKMRPLTGLRFFLALWVIAYHQSGTDRLWFEQLELSQPVASFIRTGYAAVSIFFVLSGFILAYNYDLSVTWSRRERWRFAVARFSRIYPAYFLGLLCIAPLIAFRMVKQFSPEAAVTEAVAGLLNFTLLQSWLPQTALTWNDPGWSLSNEAFFYVCFPFVGVLLWRASGTSTILAWAVGLWILSLLAPLGAVWLPVAGFGDVTAAIPMSSTSPWANLVRYHPVIRLAEFCAGILTGRIFFALQGMETWRDRRGQWFYLPAIAVTLLVASQAHRIPYPLVHNGLLLPVYACMILGLALSGGGLARWLSTEGAVFLGNASYSMYILHVPIFAWLNICWRRVLGLDATGPVWQAVYFASVVLVSSLVYKAVEEPMHYWLKRNLTQRLSPESNLPGVRVKGDAEPLG